MVQRLVVDCRVPTFLQRHVLFRQAAMGKGGGAGLCSGHGLAVRDGGAGIALTISIAGSCREKRYETN